MKVYEDSGIVIYEQEDLIDSARRFEKKATQRIMRKHLQHGKRYQSFSEKPGLVRFYVVNESKKFHIGLFLFMDSDGMCRVLDCFNGTRQKGHTFHVKELFADLL